MDFQPKKREMFDAVTDTKELMSRSLETLYISKSAGAAESQEVLDIDQGFSAAGNAQYMGTGAGGQYSQQGQWGTKNLARGESGLIRTTDESHERRETVSHTTQLTQLHHLLNSYHLGTNRIIFLIQPRPYVTSPPSGFVRGPRPVEGIQEFFLVVNQLKDQEEYCVDVRLDTGHLYEESIMEHNTKVDTIEWKGVAANAPNEQDPDK